MGQHRGLDSMEERILREKEFHNDKTTRRNRASASKFYSITRASKNFYEEILLSSCQNKQVLEYGCGSGSYAFWLAKHGAIVTGIDISDVRIEQARTKAIQEELHSNIQFLVMNAEELAFDNGSFDIVCGTGILHHLNLGKALSEIARVLKTNGKAVFVEPLGHNPVINLYRHFTPNMRTNDEHPLISKDLDFMRRYFQADFKYFHLFTLLSIPFRKVPVIFNLMLKITESMDNILLRAPFFKKQAWQVVIVLFKL